MCIKLTVDEHLRGERIHVDFEALAMKLRAG